MPHELDSWYSTFLEAHFASPQAARPLNEDDFFRVAGNPGNTVPTGRVYHELHSGQVRPEDFPDTVATLGRHGLVTPEGRVRTPVEWAERAEMVRAFFSNGPMPSGPPNLLDPAWIKQVDSHAREALDKYMVRDDLHAMPLNRGTMVATGRLNVPLGMAYHGTLEGRAGLHELQDWAAGLIKHGLVADRPAGGLRPITVTEWEDRTLVKAGRAHYQWGGRNGTPPSIGLPVPVGKTDISLAENLRDMTGDAAKWNRYPNFTAEMTWQRDDLKKRGMLTREWDAVVGVHRLSQTPNAAPPNAAQARAAAGPSLVPAPPLPGVPDQNRRGGGPAQGPAGPPPSLAR